MFLASMMILLVAHSQVHDIHIKVSNLEDEQVIVGYHMGRQRLVYDTLQTNTEGELIISGEDSLPQGVYFLYTKTFYFEFLIKEQKFSLELQKDAAYSSLKVRGSRENELFSMFQNQMTDLQKQQRELVDSLGKVTGEDSILVREAYSSLLQQMSSIRTTMVRTHEGTFFSEFLSLMVGIDIPDYDSIVDEGDRKVAQFEYYQRHYMDLLRQPSDLMRTPVVHEYVMKYFDELIYPQPDSTISALDRFLSSTEIHPPTFRYWLVTLFNHYQESKIMGMDAVTVHLAENYYLSGKADWVDEDSRLEIRKEIRFIKPNLIGSPAPELILVDSSLQKLDVSDIRSDYLVLFFYDPDCGVCRKKTPILKEAYPELQVEGAEVLAISTIADVDKWKSYIKKNDLTWFNGGDPYNQSLFRVDYNVRSTPQVYILDRDRQIIAKKLDVSQILGFIQDHKSIKNQ
jgi:peroxiredoxin